MAAMGLSTRAIAGELVRRGPMAEVMQQPFSGNRRWRAVPVLPVDILYVFKTCILISRGEMQVLGLVIKQVLPHTWMFS